MWFGEPAWLTGWSESELDRLAEIRIGRIVLADARKYGLSNYVGGAPLVETPTGTPAGHPRGTRSARSASAVRVVR